MMRGLRPNDEISSRAENIVRENVQYRSDDHLRFKGT